VDRVLKMPALQPLLAQYGHTAVVNAVRTVLSELRDAVRAGASLAPQAVSDASLALRAQRHLDAALAPSLRRVFNLTGTVLHTNLGRALLPAEAIAAVQAVMAAPSNLEYELAAGDRGDRDSHVEDLLCELTGAEAATVVNNNAAAVLLVLNTLALRKEVLVSRGELIEIGGAFRIPEIMTRAGCRLREVGTTNRTHLADFEQALGSRSAMLLKVHTSNYAVQGFTATVPEKDLAVLARDRGVPFVVDLGSGTLVDLGRYGLPKEPTPQETLAAGADLVTFSGDKLLGGPQAGIIVGRAELVKKIKRNHLKRALRVDKMTLAALEAVLRLYRQPEKLAERLPTLRLLTRPVTEIEALAWRLEPAVALAVGKRAMVGSVGCHSQIGSGALPVELLPSRALALTPPHRGRGAGTALKLLAAAFRALPVPVIGTVSDGALRFDLRCLEDEAGFVAQLSHLQLGDARP
jgi:L-seryl-tRNA(Ser) seleniumtransferase